MFKVSFKETDQPSKVVMKAGNNTVVTLRGKMEAPHFWYLMPKDIKEWVCRQNNIELYEDIASNMLLIFTEGTAKCNKNDRYNSLLGERLAESRAKQYLYKFLYTLCDKLVSYYNGIMYGGVTALTGKPGSLTADLKKYEGLYNKESMHESELLNKNSNV